MIRLVALDLSLSGTGVAWSHDHTGRAQVGTRTVHTARRPDVKGMDHDRVQAVLVDVAAACRSRPHLVVVEGLPLISGKGATSLRLAELHGVVKHYLVRQVRVPYLDVQPGTLKVWATGNGAADKDAVKAAIIADYGRLCHVGDHNAADALALLSLAAAAYGDPIAPVPGPEHTRAIRSVSWPTLDTGLAESLAAGWSR